MVPRALFLFAVGCLSFLALSWATAPLAVSPGSTSGIAHVLDRCPTFSWSAVDGATGYALVVLPVNEEAGRAEGQHGSLEATTRPAISVTIRGAAIAWTPGTEQCLEPGERYAWSVRAVFGDEPGPWADAQPFEVGLESVPDVELAVESIVERLLRERGLVVARVDGGPAVDGSATATPKTPGAALEPGGDASALAAVPGGTDAAVFASMPSFPGIPDYGVHGVTDNSVAGSAGVVGQAAAGTGLTRGVIGSVASSQGIGGLFENSGGGKILSATDGIFEKFAVTNTGVSADAAEIANATITQTLKLDGGRVLLDSGTAGSPALAWDGDLDTGVNADGNQVRISTGGTERLRLDSIGLASAAPLQTGSVLGPAAYNRFGTASASQGGIQNVQDVLVSDDLEVGDDLWVGGTLTAGSLNASHTHPGADITGTVANADTVDGQHASAFAEEDHHHLGETWTTGSAGLMVQTSETGLGFAIQGSATDTGTGSSKGVIGKASSTQGIGVFGWSTNLTHGIAVKGYSQGNAFPTAFFVNDGGGPLIVANSSDSVVNPKFMVQSDGDVEIAGVLTGSGSAATSITSSCGTFVALSFCPAGNNDGPACDSVGAGAYCEFDTGSGCTNLDPDVDNCPGMYDWYLRTE